MKIPWQMVAGWYHAVVLGALPWTLVWDPRWAPLLAGSAALVHTHVRRTRAAEPWASLWVLVCGVVFIAFNAGLRGPVWFWFAVSLVVAATARTIQREDGGRPDAADCLAVVCWASPFAVEPAFLATTGGGWLAPALMLVSARQLGRYGVAESALVAAVGPPSKEVRGTLSLRGLVATSTGLPSTVPIDLDLRAGESLAILCHDPVAAQAVADTIVGRTRPHSGEIAIDGVPRDANDRLIAFIAPGEAFVEGSLADNVGALREGPPDRGAYGAARDACGLAEVDAALDGRSIGVDGSPMPTIHRMLVLAARVLVSHYRMVVVVDPEPWVDARLGDVWRASLVRASVGRTSVWITPDPELADRADHVHELVDGSLRPL